MGTELRALLYGVVFGFGINLLTSNPDTWRGLPRYVNDYAVWWVPGLLLIVVGSEVGARVRQLRTVTWKTDESPYPGLEPFGQDRAAVYFGREVESREIHDRLLAGDRCVPIIGPSGSGKSSLIQAGVIPRLSSQWTVIGPLRPGASPFLGLAAALATTSVDRCARLLKDEATKTDAETSYLLGLLESRGRGRILVVIDQAEELVTMASAEESRLFLHLLEAVLARSGRLYVLLAGQPLLLGAISSELLFKRPYALGPLEPRLIRQVITLPAKAAGLTFEDGLVDVMVAEATVGDALPLLGHLLQRLAGQVDERRRIDTSMYEEAGRVGGAIAEHADEAYEALLAVHQQADVNQTLLQFVSWSMQEPALIPVQAGELSEVGRRVAAEFKAVRLIVEDRDGHKFSLAHEAMLRRWQRLANLVADSRDLIEKRTMLEQRALAWTRSGSPREDLLRGTLLTEAADLVKVFAHTDELARMVAASLGNRLSEARESADRVAVRAQSFRRHDAELAKAVARAAMDELAPSPTAVLTFWGLTNQPRSSRLGFGHTRKVRSVVWRTKHTLVSAADDGSICTWTTDGRLQGYTTLPAGIKGEAHLSPDTQTVAVIDRSGTVGWWSVHDRKLIASLALDAPFSRYLAWSPTGRYVAIAAAGELHIHEFDRRGHRPVCSVPVVGTGKILWSPDESMVAHCSDPISIHAFDGDRLVRQAEIGVRGFGAVAAWSPESDAIAVSHSLSDNLMDFAARELRLHDPRTGRVRRRLADQMSGAFTWIPDGSAVALILGHPTKKEFALWRVGSDEPIMTIATELMSVSTMCFSPDGRMVALAGGLSELSVLQVDTGKLVKLRTGMPREVSMSRADDRGVITIGHGALAVDDHGARAVADEGVDTVAIAPDGSAVAISSVSRLSIVDLSGQRPDLQVKGQPSSARDLVWSPANRRLAGVVRDFADGGRRMITVWPVEGKISEVVMEAGGEVAGPLAWAGDDRHLAGTKDGALAVWDAEDGELKHALPAIDSGVLAVCWSGGSVAAAYTNSQILIWSLENENVFCRCVGHNGRIRALAWEPETGYLASVSSDDHDRTLRLWETSSGQCLSVISLPGEAEAQAVQWHDGGRSVSVTTLDGWIYRWDLPALHGPVDVALPARPLTNEERRSAGLPVE